MISSSKRAITVLVINEDATDRLAIKQHLLSQQQIHYHIVEAETAEEGLTQCLNLRPDCILLDYYLTSMNGIEFINALRSRLSEHELIFPIVILTSKDDENLLVEAMRLGVSDYIIKNKMSENVLRDAIHNAISKFNNIAKITKEATPNNSQSFRDSLTQLPNRFGFEEIAKINLAAAERHKEILIVIILGVDNFKSINNRYGYETGDLLLIEIGKRLQSSLRAEDFIARIGGDEFAIIPYLVDDVVNAAVIAENLLKAFSKPFYLPTAIISISISIGIASYPDTANNFLELYRQAYLALQRAKDSGRNNYQYFNKRLDRSLRQHLMIIDALKGAIKRNELHLVYQPQYEIETGKIIGCEALLRWQNPNLGNVGPDIFINIAEEHGLMEEIGDWVLNNACHQLMEWSKELMPKNFILSINISAKQLDNPNLVANIRKLVEKYRINPNMLELELTETAVINHQDRTEQVMRAIHKLGIRIAIDDFGTGYSSLTRLMESPINTIKIDKEFIGTLPKDKKKAAIITTIIELAEKLNLRVIAEGIESADQQEFLLASGCKQGQGFYFSTPVPPATFKKFILQDTLSS